ncbi:hypothetical protein CLAFUW4_00319 [Fulvia fulva]|uniref:NAD(P)/FAD-dependent oxidoreductase n=1 Tax=Passalora fulva TaxID=5499 RepID=A0A9Q8L5K4_PASFU|nr:uncharacterized protein CLAFUR5_00318 [Fulvia fulva]KAK4636014.1 hypothetical protein CLAFUR4_00319 [Fulvia fulva]KAK4637425.1 hypothetical protein CLAFUR0_00320 [Fulvia fulva]UJO11286.1 hypothetical protein CLAFUR5_00318 [Fulvia fulva]WPV09029.1 hypothetical protein CLAFUW4_00319 [Fulvia fulva]WPV24578.1 hypothetical protein CLAFUW7_00323 [Fulvia fulva]
MAETITADYLVIGAGAMGMAFVDTLVSDTNATIVMVDRYARPGGHWTTAYPFVRLHQPSAFYGVNSRPLGEDRVDQVGLNKGLSEMATVDEVCAYYSIVMHQTFLPSGRVKYYPKHEYLGEGEWRSAVTGSLFRLQGKDGKQPKIVDATYMKVTVPSMGPPPYQVAAGVKVVPVNDLPKTTRPYGAYTVVGAGKTGIDACLWLLNNGVDPKLINWIMPRDSWFLERGGIQPGPAFAKKTSKSIADINGAVMSSTSPEDLFLRLEARQQIMRMTDKIWPTMFRCATVSIAELEQVKRIENIVRVGRVQQITTDEVILDSGAYKPAPDTLYIDCTADALAKLEPLPVFRGNQITLQSVRYCQQVFSAAFIAHVEATYSDDAQKNALSRVVPHPDEAIDYLIVTLQSHRNGLVWASHPKTAAWLSQARLDWFGTLLPPPPEDPAEAKAYYMAVAAQVQGIIDKLGALIDQLPEKDAARAKAQVART